MPYAASSIDLWRWCGRSCVRFATGAVVIRVRMFRAAGFVSQPIYLTAPDRTLRIYLDASELRCRGRGGAAIQGKAEEHRRQCTHFGEIALVYAALVEPTAVLALFGSRAEREVVVDPAFLSSLKSAD